MIREYALENFAEMDASKKRPPVNWCPAEFGTDEYKLYWVMRGLSLRLPNERRIAEGIFKAYGIDRDFTKQAKRAEDLWFEQRVNRDRLTIEQINVLVEKVKECGLEPLINAIPEKAY